MNRLCSLLKPFLQSILIVGLVVILQLPLGLTLAALAAPEPSAPPMNSLPMNSPQDGFPQDGFPQVESANIPSAQAKTPITNTLWGNSPQPQCEGIRETALRVELNRVIQDFLANDTEFDVQSTVERQWRTLNLDATFDAEVDAAIARVTNDTGLLSRFQSSWIPSQAQTLANQVTDQVFKANTLNQQLDQLSRHVADELADHLELVSAQSSSYAMDCLQRFINRQYSQAFVNIFGQQIQAARAETLTVPDAFDPDTKDFLKTHAFAFGGAAAIAVAGVTRQVIGKKIIGRITQQVVERIAGRLGTSVIPFVGEIVGGILITRDVIDSVEGALPQIQTALKVPAIKQAFRETLTTQIDHELRQESYQIAREVSNDIYAEWLDFQKDYRDTLNLAADLPEFQTLLANTTDVGKLSALVGIALNNMGRSQLIAAVENGDFERALTLPEITYKMLETSHDFHVLVVWTNLAGHQVDEVVRLELYKHLSPEKLDHKLLQEILSLGDDALIAKLALLELNDIRDLLAIATPNLRSLAVKLSAEDLRRLASYLHPLAPTAVNAFVRFLMDDPLSLRNRAITPLLQSRNIQAAIEFWQAPTTAQTIFQGLLNIFTGEIVWTLFTTKYSLTVLLGLLITPLILGLGVFWMVSRLLSGLARRLSPARREPAASEISPTATPTKAATPKEPASKEPASKESASKEPASEVSVPEEPTPEADDPSVSQYEAVSPRPDLPEQHVAPEA